jgi:hypothetical protein
MVENASNLKHRKLVGFGNRAARAERPFSAPLRRVFAVQLCKAFASESMPALSEIIFKLNQKESEVLVSVACDDVGQRFLG